MLHTKFNRRLIDSLTDSRSCQRLTCVAYAFLYRLLTLVLDDGRGNGANSDGGHGQGP